MSGNPSPVFPFLISSYRRVVLTFSRLKVTTGKGMAFRLSTAVSKRPLLAVGKALESYELTQAKPLLTVSLFLIKENFL